MSSEVPINFTKIASEEILKVMKGEDLNPETNYVRVGVGGPTCGGFSYMLDFEDSPREDDQVFEQDSIKVIVDNFSIKFIKGTVIDYISDIRGSGFKFDNPNFKGGCSSGGCESC
jgi:iron-sulfur cluster assembly protein